ncbi:MAG: DUF4910 domain-containing protein [Actinobacteria bacterium]|nr:DUF4910 domain-containing protein [Actinomycetota bacterium]
MTVDTGADLHGWMTDLFPICRSLTGDGVRETLAYLQELAPDMQVKSIESGSAVLDWTVPNEWNIRDAYVADESGRRVIDFAESNLHVVGYSTPVDAIVSRAELDEHLYSIPMQPTAIPYVTSYYSPRWGFCVSEEHRATLGEGPFRVVVDSTLEPGVLNYGEIIIEGDTSEEVLLSTYVCHPSMANNELSGPVVATALARWLRAMPSRRYTYRIVFLAETIGSLVYISRHLDELKRNVRAGWVLTCIGDDNAYSYLESRLGDSLADRISQKVMDERENSYIRYSYLERGSDERQWCAPGVDLPVASLMRSKYGTFPEYHTSLDDLEYVTAEGLQGGLDMMKDAITLMEANRNWVTTTLGEPQLGKRGLYPTLSTKESTALVMNLTNVLTYCDGNHDVIAISDRTGIPTGRVLEVIERLAGPGLIVPAGT